MSRIPPDNSVPLPEFASSGSSTMTSLFRTMALRPHLMQQTMNLLETAMREGTVEPKLKELLAIRVSQVNNCFY